MSSITNVLSRVRRKARRVVYRAWLRLCCRLRGRPYWKDHGYLKLAFHDDGDGQELLYHINGSDWWRNEKTVLSSFLEAGATVVDVGANLGFMSGLFSQLVGSEGRVHSFEPSPTTFQKLAATVEKNGLANVTLHNCGCSDKESQLLLNLTESSGNSSMRTSSEIPGKVREVQQVRVVVLDDYLHGKLDRLDLLKIDTEGFEDRVLAGARQILRRFKPVVYIELAAEFPDSSQKAIAILKEEGYRFDVEPDLSAAHAGDNFLVRPN